MSCEGTKDWVLSVGGETAVSHSEAHPFATAVRREKTYTASHGTVTVQERVEGEYIPKEYKVTFDKRGEKR